MKAEYVVGIDIGGQSAKIGLVNKKGEILNRITISSKQARYSSFLSQLSKAVLDLTKDVGIERIKGIGIGAPSSNYYTGEMLNASNVVWGKGKNIPLASDVSAALGNISVTITNDANAAAIGEMKYGVANSMKNFIEITLGTGVGSGIVIDGRLVYGSDGFAGELGHTCAVHNGRQCGCGLKGCLETYCSATGVATTAREFISKHKGDTLLKGIKDITSKDVFDAAEKGDKLAIKIFEYTGKVMGEKFADFIPFMAPEAIVLFGGLSKASKYFLPALKKAMNENVVFLWRDKVEVLISSLKESDAAILGASALAW